MTRGVAKKRQKPKLENITLKHFATFVRYGQAVCNQSVHGLHITTTMDILGLWDGFLSQFKEKQIDRNVSTAQIGDLIEFAYPSAGFSLWGIYDGDEHVIHFGVADENVMQKLCRSFFQQMLPSAGGDRLLRKAKICRQRITEMKLPPGVRIKVNNGKHDLWPAPEDLVRSRCDALLGKEFTYDLLSLNCEHFATFVRYGQAVCNQIPFKKKDQGHVDATQVFERIMQQHWMETETYL